MFLHIRLVHKHLFANYLDRLILTVSNLHTEVHHRPMCARRNAPPIRNSDAQATMLQLEGATPKTRFLRQCLHLRTQIKKTEF